MSTTPVPAACRAYEEALERALSAAEPRETPFRAPATAHGASCPRCAALAAILEETTDAFAVLLPPAPGAALLAALRELGSSPAPRLLAREALSFLAPGALRPPEMGAALSARLSAIPARHPRAGSRPSSRVELLPAGPGGDETKGRGVPGSGVTSRRPAWTRDWRVGVALAYAATLVISTAMGLDPTTLARRTAAEATSAGEHAFAEARTVAERRLASTAPLRQKLDYRIYRTVAVSKAKISAYASVLLERIVSPTDTAFAQADDGEPRPAGSSRLERRTAFPGAATEPRPAIFRS